MARDFLSDSLGQPTGNVQRLKIKKSRAHCEQSWLERSSNAESRLLTLRSAMLNALLSQPQSQLSKLSSSQATRALPAPTPRQLRRPACAPWLRLRVWRRSACAGSRLRLRVQMPNSMRIWQHRLTEGQAGCRNSDLQLAACT